MPPQPANFKNQRQCVTDLARDFNHFAKDEAISLGFVYTDSDPATFQCTTRCSTPAASDKQRMLLDNLRR